MLRIKKNICFKGGPQELGQQSIEYMLLMVAVIVLMLLAIAPNGFFTRAIDVSLGKTIGAMGGTIKGRICFTNADGEIEEDVWDTDGWIPSSCSDGEIQTRSIHCDTGCCEFPIPNTSRKCPY